MEKKRVKLTEVAKGNAKTFALEHEQGKIDYTLDLQVIEKEGKATGEETQTKEGEQQLEEGETQERTEEGGSADADKSSNTPAEGGEVNGQEGATVQEGGESDSAGKDKEKETTADEKTDTPRLISTKPSKPRRLDRIDAPLEKGAAPGKKPDA